MLILGFDSAGGGASVAILHDDAIIAACTATMTRGQAEILMPMIAKTLSDARVEAADLDAIGVATGPGSFTGLRIAVAAARGLALAANIPAIGVSRFAAIAARFPLERRGGRALLIALDTRRDDYFLQLFTERAETPFLADDDGAARLLPDIPLLLAGDAAQRLVPTLVGRDVTIAQEPDAPCAAHVARLAAAEFCSGLTISPPRPLYLRAPDTTMPRNAVLP